MDLIILVIAFVPLIFGATLLVDSSVALAKRFNVPGIVIGLTIVAFGTSSPELIVNLFSSAAGSTELALGNIAGSNLFNILVILGLSALFVPLKVKNNTVWIEIPLCLLAAIMIFVVANDRLIDQAATSVISRIDGLILLAFFTIFIGYNIKLMLRGSFTEDIEARDYSLIKAIVLLIIGLILLFIGGRTILVYAVRVAQSLGLGERVIALTIVSAGTSLPELTTSLVAVRKGSFDLAVGNVVGSNIFNAFFILGASVLVRPIFPSEQANFDLLFNLGASLLLFFFLFTGKGRQLERWEGVSFLVLYGAYLALLLSIK